MLEYQLDQIKIVDFLLLAKFWACPLFFDPPSISYFVYCTSVRFTHYIFSIVHVSLKLAAFL